MKLIFYFYHKFLISFTICFFSCLSVFYIFSLLGNLGENLMFIRILRLSLINSFQILAFIPSIIVLLSMVLFLIFLRSRNELIIIKSILSIKKLTLAFLPIVIIFSVIEINKNLVSEKLDIIKSEFLDSEKYSKTKVIISNNKDLKTYTILKELNLTNSSIGEFQKYEIDGDYIKGGEYSNEISFEDGMLITNKFTKFSENKIRNIKERNVILNDISVLIDKKIVILRDNKIKLFELDYKIINKITYVILFYLSIFLVLFNKKAVDQKESVFISVLLCFLLLFYTILVLNIELNLFDMELKLLATTLMCLVFYKNFKNE